METASNTVDTVAVIGAGVIGAAVACALAREGRQVLLLDPSEPGAGGASFGNVGHIGAELVEPLPSTALLLGFWRLLYAVGGPLDIPLRRLPAFLPFAARFARAAFRQQAHTRHLAPLVRPAAATLEATLREIGRPELLRRNGHYEVWLDGRAADKVAAHTRAMQRLEVPTRAAPADLLESIRHQAGAQAAAGLWFPDCAHVVDPLEIVRALVAHALQRGAQWQRTRVLALAARQQGIEIVTAERTLSVAHAVVCAGPWSRELLRPFGLRAPLEAARGYHVELPAHAPMVDAPILYTDHYLVVTPMTGRLRASSDMEFAGLDAPPDPRKPARLRQRLRRLGYACPAEGASWLGARPVLPDYLPGIGRAPGANLYYAIGHQHIGLTLAAVTGGLIADLLAGRTPRHDISAFDLRRFG